MALMRYSDIFELMGEEADNMRTKLVFLAEYRSNRKFKNRIIINERNEETMEKYMEEAMGSTEAGGVRIAEGIDMTLNDLVMELRVLCAVAGQYVVTVIDELGKEQPPEYDEVLDEYVWRIEGKDREAEIRVEKRYEEN